MSSNDTPFPELLLQFAASFGNQVEGHARQTLTDEQKQALDRFVDGGISPEERQQLVTLMGGNEEAIEYLATRLK